MIDDKKLICAFIYSAYSSGYRGLMLKKDTREKHKQAYAHFIRTGEGYPLAEIESTQPEVTKAIRENRVREYVYGDHLEVVLNRIESESKQKFEEAVKSPFALNAAINCPVSFYEVLEVDPAKRLVVARNLHFPLKPRKLKVLDGLEFPAVGENISGHWDFMLERVDKEFSEQEYGQRLKDYLVRIKRR